MLTLPKEGQLAPPFTALDQAGTTVTLEDLRGKWIALYFYPKDDTPGCTTEACGLRDSWKEFKKDGVVILGVSPDSVKSHEKFSKKFNLPFSLLADETKKMVQDYGVYGEKKFMGRKFMGVHRTTFLIAPDGIISKIWLNVKPPQHADEVLAALKNKQKAGP